MGEVEDLLRELVTEARVQTTHLNDMKRNMEDMATQDDVTNARKAIIGSRLKNGNTDFYQKVIVILIIALCASFGLTKAVEYVIAGG